MFFKRNFDEILKYTQVIHKCLSVKYRSAIQNI